MSFCPFSKVVFRFCRTIFSDTRGRDRACLFGVFSKCSLFPFIRNRPVEFSKANKGFNRIIGAQQCDMESRGVM